MSSITFNASGLETAFDGLAEAAAKAARPAAQKGAQVIYDQVKHNVRRIGRVTGNLDRAIYQAFSKDNSGEGFAEYHISWNVRKAPHGHLLEYGHVQRYVVFVDRRTGKWVTIKRKPLAKPRIVGARPFIRPAASAFPAAQTAMLDEYFAQLQRAGVL